MKIIIIIIHDIIQLISTLASKMPCSEAVRGQASINLINVTKFSNCLFLKSAANKYFRPNKHVINHRN